MAAVTLPTPAPISAKTTTGVPTTLQEFVIPANASKVSVRGSAALWLQGDVGVDGDAVTSASAVPLDAGMWHEIASGKGRIRGSRSFYVAAQASTATVYVLCEQATDGDS